MTNVKRFLHFLDRYSHKDIDSISQMLAQDVILRDWNIYTRGSEAVTAATLKNFRDADTIEIEVLHIYENENSVAGEIRIVVDKTIELYVVDVIQFDSESKVKAIRSYKGRGD